MEKDATDMLITIYQQLQQTQEKLGESEATQAALQAALKQRQEGQTSQPPPQVINLEGTAPTTVPPPQQAEQTATSTSAAPISTDQSLDM